MYYVLNGLFVYLFLFFFNLFIFKKLISFKTETKSITVRRRISESQLSEIAYYPATKIRDVIDESWLFVCNIKHTIFFFLLTFCCSLQQNLQ